MKAISNNGASSKIRIRVALILSALIVTYLAAYRFPDTIESWNDRLLDRLFTTRFRHIPSSPGNAFPLVHVDANFYVTRLDHALIVRQLANLGAAVQVIDHVFDGTVSTEADRLLADAIQDAGNVVLGVDTAISKGETAGLRQDASGLADAPEPIEGWPIAGGSRSKWLLTAGNSRVSIPAIGKAAAGHGFMNLTPDPDGVLRRVPLVVRSKDTFYPSLALRAVCKALNVTPERVRIKPGNAVMLRGETGDGEVMIPIDLHGQAILDFDRASGRMPHLSYSEILESLSDPGKFKALEAVLTGAIVIISENVDSRYIPRGREIEAPLASGVIHAALIRSMLTGSTVRPLAEWALFATELMLLGVVFLLSIRFSSTVFLLGGLAAAFGYLGIVAGAFLFFHLLFPLLQPLFALMLSVSAISGAMAVEKALLFARTERARRIAERELKIGRRIQAGFFPATLPDLNGWDIAVHFEPARHVAGDFYDIFTLEHGKRVGIVIADVCDKGLGAALFMALFRSLIRVLSGADGPSAPESGRHPDGPPAGILERTVSIVNNYISGTHGEEGMFATLFFGLLDPVTGELHYINGGHEPLLILRNGRIQERLNPTGPAVGAFPSATFLVRRVRLEPADTLIGFTDGVVDATNGENETFGRERLEARITGSFTSSEALLASIRDTIREFVSGSPPADDIACVAVGRTS